MATRRLVILACAVGLACALATACTRVPSTFTCAASAECLAGGVAGTCEPTGFCSVDDPACASGRRYVAHAGGELAGACVDDAADPDAGAGGGPDGPDGTPVACTDLGVAFTSPTTGRCYARVEGSLTSVEAGTLCATSALIPAILSGPGELEEVGAALLPASLGAVTYHVGFTHDDGSFRWADGVEPTVIPWAPGEPSLVADGTVGVFAHDPGASFALHARAPDATAGVVCEDPTVVVRAPSEYLVFQGDVAPEAPAATCALLGGTLVVITTADENLFVAGTVGRRDFLIGLRDDLVEGTFVWASGEPFAFTSWGGTEPDDATAAGDEDCVWSLAGTNALWFDIPCGVDPHAFVCERAAP